MSASPFAETMASFPLLSLVTFLPVAGALLLLLVPGTNERAIRGTGLFISLVAFIASVFVWRRFADVTGFQLVERHAWIPSLGIGYTLGIDGISFLLVMLTTFITPIALLSSTHAIEHRVKEFTISVLLLETAMLGALVSLDLVLFYVFWEAMLIPMYLLIGVWGGKERIYATTKFFLYTMLGSVLMLVGVLYLYLRTNPASAAFADVLEIPLTRTEQLWLFAAFGLAFAIKVPLFPFHTWLPDAHTEAPTAGSVILAGVLLKMGTYGFLRFAFPLFPEAVGVYSVPMMALAVIGIIYGAMTAYAQTDVKKLVAYSSVSHMGYIVLGMFALTKAGIEGAMLQMLNHGISTGALFLCVGVLYERRHTREISEYGGLAKVVPVFATIFMIVTFSSIGLPGTNGFVGEFLILTGTFEEALSSHLDATLAWKDFLLSWRVVTTVFATIATLGVVLGAVYMLSMFRRVMFGEIKNPKNLTLKDLSPRELLYLVPMVVLIFLIGFFPNVLLNKMHRSVDAFVDHYRPAIVKARSPETVAAREGARAVEAR